MMLMNEAATGVAAKKDEVMLPTLSGALTVLPTIAVVATFCCIYAGGQAAVTAVMGDKLHTAFLAVRAAEVAHEQVVVPHTPGGRQWMLCW
jgi:hypothetical protein